MSRLHVITITTIFCFGRKNFAAMKGYGEDQVSYVYDGSVIIPTGSGGLAVLFCEYQIQHTFLRYYKVYLVIYLRKVFFLPRVHLNSVKAVLPVDLVSAQRPNLHVCTFSLRRNRK